jgi:hypothetical protein
MLGPFAHVPAAGSKICEYATGNRLAVTMTFPLCKTVAVGELPIVSSVGIEVHRRIIQLGACPKERRVSARRSCRIQHRSTRHQHSPAEVQVLVGTVIESLPETAL